MPRARRQVPAADRGHRPRTLDPRGDCRDPARPDLAGLDWDGDVVSQFARKDRHAEVAHEMLAATAPPTSASPRKKKSLPFAPPRPAGGQLSRSSCRPGATPIPATHPDAPYVIRMKAPHPLSAGAERLSAYRPRQVDLPEFRLAEEFGGRCHLRFDDTNPEKEEQEYVDDRAMTCAGWASTGASNLYHASDYFERCTTGPRT
jgi:glutamyl/glutaminyl-tRNA synthetase